MNVNLLVRIMSATLFTVLMVGVLSAQQNNAVKFSTSGISVFFKTESIGLSKVIAPEGGVYIDASDVDKDSRAHRIILDRTTGHYFGYDVVVESAGTEKKIRLSIRPLSVSPPEAFRLKDLSASALPKYPGDLEIDE